MDKNTIDITLIAKDLASSVIKGVNSTIEDTSKSVSGNMSTSLEKFQDKIKGVASSALNLAKVGSVALGGSLLTLGGLALKSASDFETMGVSLLTTFKGNKKEADAAQKQITAFASKTPYQLGEVMNSFIKLKNYGLDPSEKALTAYGDTASAMGKSLDQMVEAVADAGNKNFERLKEFGVISEQQGDKVTFTFRGIKTTVKNNSEEVQKYLVKLGETNFAGGMDAQSKTLAGTMSTLKDNFSLALTQMANDSGLLDVAKKAVIFLGDKIAEWTPKIIKFIKDFGDTFKKTFSDIVNSSAFNTTREYFIKFINYVVDNKGAFIAGISAVGIAILATFVPALVASTIAMGSFMVASLPLIATFALIGAAGFLLYKMWTENWGGMRDKLTEVWGFIQPVLQSIWQWLSTDLPPILISFAETTKTVWGNIVEAFQKAWEFIRPIFELIGSFITGFIVPVIQNLLIIMRIVWSGISWAVQIAWTGIKLAIQPVLNWINDTIVPVIQGIADKLKPIWEGVQNTAVGVWDIIKQGFKSGINSIIDMLNGLSRGLNTALEGASKLADSIPGGHSIDFRVPKIPPLATGTNYVPRDMLAYIHKGEAVVPAKYNNTGNNGGDGIIINNNYYNNENSESISNRIAFQLKNLSFNN